MSFLGVELGMTGCRALAVSAEGVPLAQAYHGYPNLPPAGKPQEMDSHDVWAAVRQVIGEVAARTYHQDPVRALTITAPAGAWAPLSAEGRVLASTILGNDPRGTEYIRRLEERLGAQRLFEITGHVPGTPYALGTLCWLYAHKPELFRGAVRSLPWSSLMAYWLGGASTCDETTAARTGLWDIAARRWSQELLEACGLPAQILPEVATAGAPVGTLSTALARELGLPSGVRLVLGGHDLCCNALGAGVSRPGMAVYHLSTAMYLAAAFQAIPLISLLLNQRLDMEQHVVPALSLGVWSNPVGGGLLRWFRDTLAPQEARQAQRRGANVYEELLAEMPDRPTNLLAIAPRLIPLTGPATGALLGLTTSTTRGEIIKALLEGMTFHFAEGQERLQQVGIRVEVYRATGGGARLERWLQLVADVLGVPVERTQIGETGALGAALLAGVGSGAFRNVAEAVAVLVRVQQRFQPDPGRHATYRAKLEHYRRMTTAIPG